MKIVNLQIMKQAEEVLNPDSGLYGQYNKALNALLQTKFMVNSL